jgi:hypothetical protein
MKHVPKLRIALAGLAIFLCTSLPAMAQAPREDIAARGASVDGIQFII